MNFAATQAHEPTLQCPYCRNDIRLTESLAGPLLEKTKRTYEALLADRNAEMGKIQDQVREERESLTKQRAELNDHVAKRLDAERAQLIAAEGKKAREAAAAELATKDKEAAELKALLEANNAKLAEA